MYLYIFIFNVDDLFRCVFHSDKVLSATYALYAVMAAQKPVCQMS